MFINRILSLLLVFRTFFKTIHLHTLYLCIIFQSICTFDEDSIIAPLRLVLCVLIIDIRSKQAYILQCSAWVFVWRQRIEIFFFKLGGMGTKKLKHFLIKVLAISGNSKDFSIFQEKHKKLSPGGGGLPPALSHIWGDKGGKFKNCHRVPKFCMGS